MFIWTLWLSLLTGYLPVSFQAPQDLGHRAVEDKGERVGGRWQPSLQGSTHLSVPVDDEEERPPGTAHGYRGTDCPSPWSQRTPQLEKKYRLRAAGRVTY